MTARAERLTLHDAQPLLGVPSRTVQALAARGAIPGAAKIGRLWTFDPKQLRRFIAARARAGKNQEGFEEYDRHQERVLISNTFREPGAHVYVVGYGAYVKIGFSAAEKGNRTKGLQTGAPVKLKTYAVLEGGRRLESYLHDRFETYRLEGEWFKKRGNLARWLAQGCQITVRDARKAARR